MRRRARSAAALGLALGLALGQSGCVTLARLSYTAAVDPRSVSEQAADAQTEAWIRKAYFLDWDMRVLSIKPYVYLGQVFLVGTYGNETQRQKAVSLADAIATVQSVTSYLLPDVKQPDCTLADSLKLRFTVRTELIKDTSVFSTNVAVDTVQCRLVLLGVVGSEAQRAKAEARARTVSGARAVESFLFVRPSPSASAAR